MNYLRVTLVVDFATHTGTLWGLENPEKEEQEDFEKVFLSFSSSHCSANLSIKACSLFHQQTN